MAQGRRELPPALTAAALADLLRDAITRPLAEAAPSLMDLALTGPWQGAALAGRLASGAWGTLSETGSVDPGCDQRQWALQDGPAHDALTVDLIISGDLGRDPRWPRWRPAALMLGVRAAASIRLHAGRTLGTLTLYSPTPLSPTPLPPAPLSSGRPRAMDGVVDEWADLATLAAHLSVLVEGSERRQQLERALVSRSTVGQAVGLLRSRFGLDADQGFALLRRHSQQRNVKLIELARAVVATGELPGLDREPDPNRQSRFRAGAAGDCAVREPAHPGQWRS